MTKEQSKSFTFRIPASIDKAFRQQVGERDRGRFLVQALQKALGLEPEAKHFDDGRATDLEDKITELAHRLEVFQTVQDNIRQNLAHSQLLKLEIETLKLEQDKILQRLTDIEGKVESPHTNDSSGDLQSKTLSKTEIENNNEDNVRQSKTRNEILIEIPENATPYLFPERETVPTKEILSGELYKILENETGKKWGVQQLKSYRKGKNKEKWHQIGACKFKYSREEMVGAKHVHYWLIEVPT